MRRRLQVKHPVLVRLRDNLALSASAAADISAFADRPVEPGPLPLAADEGAIQLTDFVLVVHVGAFLAHYYLVRFSISEPATAGQMLEVSKSDLGSRS